MTSSATRSEAVGKPDSIADLAHRVSRLTSAVDFWNHWMLWGLVFAAIAAVWVVLTTRLAVIRSKELSLAQSVLDSAKDRQLQSDLAQKAIEIGKLNVQVEVAAKAIADAQSDAARANASAEEEKLARLQLEKLVNPRTLTLQQRIDGGNSLGAFTHGLSGRKVVVNSYSGDAEGIVFSLEVVDVLTRAGIDVDPVIGRIIPVGMVDLGVIVTGPVADKSFLEALGAVINGQRANAVRIEWNDKFTDDAVFVGSKPVPGFPDVSTISPPK